MRPAGPIAWQTYPALYIAAAFSLGIVAETFASLTLQEWALGAALSIGLMLGGYISKRFLHLHALIKLLGLATLIFAAGGLHTHLRHQHPPHHLLHRLKPSNPHSPKAILGLKGRIINFPSVSGQSIRFTLAAESLTTTGSARFTTGRVQITLWRPYNGSVEAYPRLGYQQHIHIRAKPRVVPAPTNPAAFDYKTYLARQGIHVQVSTADPTAVHRLADRLKLRHRVVLSVRRYIQQGIQLVPSPKAQAVLNALLLGNRSRIDNSTRRQFIQTGLMHLLAISGLHVMIIGLMFYGLMHSLLHRLCLEWRTVEWSRSLLTMTVLVLYCLLTGAPASVVRAVIMTGVLIGGVLAQRIYHPLNALGMAGLVLLILNPDQLFTAGFQLSFSAVASLLTLTSVLLGFMPAGWHKQPSAGPVLNTVFASLSATLGTLPVMLFHFGQAAFGGLLLNLVAIPLTGLILTGALLTVLSQGLTPALALPFGQVTNLATQGLLTTAALGNQWLGWVRLEQYLRDGWLVLTLVLALMALVQWNRPRIRWRLVVLALLFAAVPAWQNILNQQRPSLEVLFFDVDQGDGALLKLPNGHHLLIDGGNRTKYTDYGQRTVVPHLKQYGIRSLSVAAFSHAHSDHMGGLLSVLQEIPVQRVVYNGQPFSSALFQNTFLALDSLKIPHVALTAGDTLLLDPRVRIQALAPLVRPDSAKDANEASLVLKITYQKITFLFTGDIERSTEQALVSRYGSYLQADVIKVPHHGSQTSSTPAFVQQASSSNQPCRAVISVGQENKFGLPDPPVIQRWQAACSSVVSTARSGAVWLTTDGQQLWEKSWH